MVLPNKATSSRTIPLYTHYTMNNCLRHTFISLSPPGNNDFHVILLESTCIRSKKDCSYLFLLTDTTMLTCLQQPLYNNKHLLPYYQTTPCLPVYSTHFTITNTSLPYYRTQLYLLAYSNHLTITSTSLPYYQRHDCTYLPTGPSYNNIHLSAILPETKIYLSAYSNHLTITSTSTILPEIQLCFPAYTAATLQ